MPITGHKLSETEAGYGQVGNRYTVTSVLLHVLLVNNKGFKSINAL